MKLSICVEMILPGIPFLQKVRTVAEHGFDAIEFWSWMDKDIEGLANLCHETGITVSNFSGHRKSSLIYTEDRETCIREVEESIQVARILGCNNLMLLTDKLGEGGEVVRPGVTMGEKEKDFNIVSTLKELATIAQEKGVFLHLEPVNTRVDHPGYYLDSSHKAFDLVRQVDNPQIRVLYDIYHMQIMEGRIVSTLTNNLDAVGYVHFANVPSRHEPGAGELNFRNILRALNESGYDGYVGLEFEPLRDFEQAADIIKKCMERVEETP